MNPTISQEHPVEKAEIFDYTLKQLEQFFDNAMQERLGGNGASIADWPVRVHVNHPDYHPHWVDPDMTFNPYEYSYPETYFRNLLYKYDIWIRCTNKQEYKKMLILLLDRLKNNSIDVYLFHLGLYILNGASEQRISDTLQSVGKKRKAFYYQQPRMQLVQDDEYMIVAWRDLKRREGRGRQEKTYYPALRHTRIQFEAEHFAYYNGLSFDEADWVEPVFYGEEHQVIQHTSEKDPMASPALDTNMQEGEITLGHEGSSNGLRHFVNGETIQAGQQLQVKFGDGWITGRYEWGFQKGDPIRIHSARGEHFNIAEGHRVRIRK